jgi:hypothetical protein
MFVAFPSTLLRVEREKLSGAHPGLRWRGSLAHLAIPSAQMYSDLDRWIETLRRCEVIKEREVRTLCDRARELLLEESNVQRVCVCFELRSPTSAHTCPGRQPRNGAFFFSLVLAGVAVSSCGKEEVLSVYPASLVHLALRPF